MLPFHFLFTLLVLFQIFSMNVGLKLGVVDSCDLNDGFFDYRVVDVNFEIPCEDIINHVDFDTGMITISKTVTFSIKITTETRLPCNEEEIPDLNNYLYFSNYDPTLRVAGNCDQTKKVYIRPEDLFGGNRLTNVAEDVFTNMPNLKQIDICEQNLTSLDFLSSYAEERSALSLKILSLHGNSINLSSGFSFRKFTSLHRIDLASNAIDNIPEGMFDLKYMSGLYLESNSISFIDLKAFPQTITFDFGFYSGLFLGETFIPGIIPSGTFSNIRSGSIYIANIGGDGFAKNTFYNGTDGSLELNIGGFQRNSTSYQCCDLKGLDTNSKIRIVGSYSCMTPENVTVFDQNVTNILPHFHCCEKDEFFNEESKDCQTCVNPPFCSNFTQESCLSDTAAFSCSECIDDYYLNTVTNTCKSCKMPESCSFFDYDKGCDLISGKYSCSGCNEGYLLNRETNSCSACLKNQTLCQEYSQTCVPGSQTLQCLRCLNSSRYEISESGICESVPSDNSLIIALSSTFASLLLVAVVSGLIVMYTYKKRELDRKNKLYGMSPEDFVSVGQSLAADLRTDEEYYTETGKTHNTEHTLGHASSSFHRIDSSVIIERRQRNEDSSYGGIDAGVERENLFDNATNPRNSPYYVVPPNQSGDTPVRNKNRETINDPLKHGKFEFLENHEVDNSIGIDLDSTDDCSSEGQVCSTTMLVQSLEKDLAVNSVEDYDAIVPSKDSKCNVLIQSHKTNSFDPDQNPAHSTDNGDYDNVPWCNRMTVEDKITEIDPDAYENV